MKRLFKYQLPELLAIIATIIIAVKYGLEYDMDKYFWFISILGVFQCRGIWWNLGYRKKIEKLYEEVEKYKLD